MKINRIAVIFVILLIVISSFLVLTNRFIEAQDSTKTDEGMSNKLDEVLKNQKMILEDLASIKEELNIIKVRITQSQ